MSVKRKALDLIELGLPIIPLCSHTHEFVSLKHKSMCPCAGKMPLIKGWRTHENTNEGHLKQWEEEFREFNIGLPLGSISGYCGIDVDGELGEQALQDKSKGDIPDTWEYSTGAGRRLLYLLPMGVQTRKKVQICEGEHQECALLCEGQQTVIPPSIHISGHVYEWIEGKDPASIDCALAPQWILDEIVVSYQGGVEGGSNSSAMSVPKVSITDGISFTMDLTQDPHKSQYGIPSELRATAEEQRREEAIVKRESLVAGVINKPITTGSRDNTMTQIIGHFCAQPNLRNEGQEAMLERCRAYNLEYCDPPLEESAINAKVMKFWEAEEIKTQKIVNNAKPPFVPKQWAQKVIKAEMTEGRMYCFCAVGKQWYKATSNVAPWEELGPVTRGGAHPMEKVIGDIIEDPRYGGFPEWNMSSKVSEVLRVLGQECLVGATQEGWGAFDMGSKNNDHNSEIIVFNNGVLHLPTMEMIQWDPNKYKTTVKIHVDYDPEATCPNFEGYLKDWLDDPSQRLLLQEFAGTMLIPRNNGKAYQWISGTTNTGKSTYLRVICSILKSNYSALSFPQLAGKFKTIELRNKLCNICDDTDAEYNMPIGIFKNITGGGELVAEPKGLPAVRFNVTAKLLCVSNKKPMVRDLDEAYLERLKFISFDKQQPNDPRMGIVIADNCRKEVSGIVNWMLEGLKRFTANGFTQSEKGVEEKMLMQDERSSIRRFLKVFFITTQEQVPLGSDGALTTPRILKPLLYPLFKAYTKEEGGDLSKIKTKSNFYKEVAWILGDRVSLRKLSYDFTYNAAGRQKQGEAYEGLWWNPELEDDDDLLEVLATVDLEKAVKIVLKECKPPDNIEMV